MYNNLTEIMNIKDDTERKFHLRRYNVQSRAAQIANKRFIENVKYIYSNCTPSSLDNGDFDRLCETLGFGDNNAINRDINSATLSELIKHKNALGSVIYDIIDCIRELSEKNENLDYNILLIRMFCIVGTKQDILNLYGCMLSRLKLELIKAIQNQLNQ